jgi:hypothetical protein
MPATVSGVSNSASSSLVLSCRLWVKAIRMKTPWAPTVAALSDRDAKGFPS